MPPRQPWAWAWALIALTACPGPTPAPSPGPRRSPPPAGSPPSASPGAPVPASEGPNQAPEPSPRPTVGLASSAPAPHPEEALAGWSPEAQALAKACLPPLMALARRDFELSQALAGARAPRGEGPPGPQGDAAWQALVVAPQPAKARRLLVALASPGPVAKEAQVGERLVGRRLWLSGGETREFEGPGGLSRRLRLDGQGRPLAQRSQELLSQSPRRIQVDAWRWGPEGATEERFTQELSQDAQGQPALAKLEEGFSFVQRPGLPRVGFEAWSWSATAQGGSYRLRLGPWLEEGLLQGLPALEQGWVPSSPEALASWLGTSHLKEASGLAPVWSLEAKAEERRLSWGGTGGPSLRLRPVGQGRWAGDLSASGAVVAQVAWSQGPDLGVAVQLQLPGAPQAGLRFQHGWARPSSGSPGAGEARVLTLAGAEPGQVDGPGPEARFRKLYQLAPSRLDAAKAYLVDGGANRVRELRWGPGHALSLRILAGTGAPGSTDGPGPLATFQQPFGLAVGPQDELYVSEGKRIRLIEAKATGPVVRTWAGEGLSGQRAFALAAGLCLSPEGTLYVAEAEAHQVHAYATTGAQAGKRLATFGSGQAGSSDGAASVARFDKPLALALQGPFLYVAEQEGRRIRRIALDEPARTVTSLVVGPADRSLDGTDGPLPGGPYGLGPPSALLPRPDGSLWVGGPELRALLPQAAGLRSVAAGEAQGSPVDGPAEQASFGFILGLSEGPDGAVLIADGSRLRAWVPPGWHQP